MLLLYYAFANIPWIYYLIRVNEGMERTKKKNLANHVLLMYCLFFSIAIVIHIYYWLAEDIPLLEQNLLSKIAYLISFPFIVLCICQWRRYYLKSTEKKTWSIAIHPSLLFIFSVCLSILLTFTFVNTGLKKAQYINDREDAASIFTESQPASDEQISIEPVDTTVTCYSDGGCSEDKTYETIFYAKNNTSETVEIALNMNFSDAEGNQISQKTAIIPFKPNEVKPLVFDDSQSDTPIWDQVTLRSDTAVESYEYRYYTGGS